MTDGHKKSREGTMAAIDDWNNGHTLRAAVPAVFVFVLAVNAGLRQERV
jgi:hypothetical protein